MQTKEESKNDLSEAIEDALQAIDNEFFQMKKFMIVDKSFII